MRNNPAVPIEKFAEECSDLSTHLSMKEGSFQGLIQYEAERHKLFMVARSQGVEHMRCFAYHFHGSVEDKISTASYDGKLDGYKNACLTYEKKIPTGDAEFDKFRKTLFNYDIYWHYSDDIDVSRRGMETDRYIDECLKKGGIYKIFHEHWKEQNKKKQ